MLHPNIIERAYQLASGVTTIQEVRNALRREGYSSVDEHLAGPTIKADLKKRLMRAGPAVASGADAPTATI